MDPLVAWLGEHCESSEHRDLWSAQGRVELRTVASGDRVVVAAHALRKGLRLPVPPRCILSEDLVRASPIGRLLGALDKYTLFAMFLLQQRALGAHSFWAAYVGVLPREFRFHPITFVSRMASEPPLQAALLGEPLLLRALQSQDERLRGEYRQAVSLLTPAALARDAELAAAFGAGAPSYDDFLWGSFLVISRAFDMQEPKMMVMLPFADSMNHDSRAPTVQWRPKLPKGFFVVTILRDLEAGTELTADYHGAAGARRGIDDLKQYVMYGFVESGAFRNVVQAAALLPAP
jgi:hypothetical protein